MDYKERYNLWLTKAKDKKILKELKAMTDEQKNLAFFKDMSFGTAGIRGTVGAGSNCMNIYTVGKTTTAVSKYLTKHGGKSVAISYDNRNMSFEFARLAASIFAFHGIKTYITKKMMPTPFLSYMVRFYKTDMGVMITASHNPREYNGYKVYDSDGCQLLDKPSLDIMEISNKLDLFKLEFADFDEAVKKGLIVFAEKDVLEAYKKDVKKQSKNKIKDLKIVYSALNGTGIHTLPQILRECGAKIILNKVQCKADKNFTTCPYPNPEKLEVFETSLPIAKENQADLIILSDPDADRVGVEVLHKGEYVHLSGNEMGALLTDYILTRQKVKDGYIVKSIVSTNLAKQIAEKHGVACKDVLTGFKYIGEFITGLEKKKQEKKYLLGFEESYGYLIGTHVRDKDATVASLVIAEMASEYKKQNKTLIDRLEELFAEFGFYENKVLTYKFAGSVGAEKMTNILEGLRKNNPTAFGDKKVVSQKDYAKGIDGLPKANVLQYDLTDGAQVIVRPSGTEPIIKVYITLSETKAKNAKSLKNITKDIDLLLK